jgi:crossover junction endodeoxyribonuclease RuvC
LSQSAGVRVLGLDPGSLRTGWGVVEPGPGGRGLRLIACGALTPPARDPLPQRLRHIFQGLGQVISEHQPREMAVEGVFTAQNARSALVLGQARGVALLAGALAGLAIHEYSPASVKQALVGGGRAAKEQVRAMVEALLKQSLPAHYSQDVSDALALAVCHLHSRELQARGLK